MYEIMVFQIKASKMREKRKANSRCKDGAYLTKCARLAMHNTKTRIAIAILENNDAMSNCQHTNRKN